MIASFEDDFPTQSSDTASRYSEQRIEPSYKFNRVQLVGNIKSLQSILLDISCLAGVRHCEATWPTFPHHLTRTASG